MTEEKKSYALLIIFFALLDAALVFALLKGAAVTFKVPHSTELGLSGVAITTLFNARYLPDAVREHFGGK